MKSELWKKYSYPLGGTVIFGLLLGFIMPLVLPIGNYWNAVLSTFGVSLIALLFLLIVWVRSGSSRQLFWMMLIAFLLRITIGVLLTLGLPKFGYPEEHQLAGYFFPDAFNRDAQAWTLATNGNSILAAFSGEFVNDQYGGLLGLSAIIYRLFSADAHRPYLMIIVSAAVSAMGLPFLVKASRRFVAQIYANLAGWVLVFFPEILLLGSTQMREPYLITAFCVAFWAVSTWLSTQKRALRMFAFIVSAAAMLLISSRSALPLLAFLMVWIWIEISSQTTKKYVRLGGWVLLVLILLGVLVASWAWFEDVMRWDMLLAYRASGWIELIFESTPEWLHAPFIIIYGILQPVLPAAIVDPAPWLWRVVGILRGLGWYALLPFLLYSFFVAFKVKDRPKKQLLLWVTLAVWVWIILSSARAGGDQWDNPRYRMLLIPWMSLLAAYVLNWSKAHHSRWFWRWVMVEGIFLTFFTHWYLSRYYGIFKRLPFAVMIILIIGLSGLVMGVGWFWDRRRKKTMIAPEINQD